MCRIAGLYDPSSKSLKQDLIAMRDSMYRGGPDDEGFYVDEEFNLGLAHRRLSLLDLSAAGHQPMESDDTNIQLVFNGEIYNYKELKQRLESLGYLFNTKTDTEVIVKAYQEWGTDCFRLFNGMFALAIFDKTKSKLILARDHVGMKPLYYFIDKTTVIFASEIRAFKVLQPQLKQSEVWRALFLVFGHIPEPFTTLENVKALPKGSYFEIALPGLNHQLNYFYKNKYSSIITKEEEAVDAVREALTASVQRHLISDAPIGLFLSGGIDSSLLTLLAAPIVKDQLHTVSIDFDEAQFSEEKYQQVVVNLTGAKHSVFKVTKQDLEDNFDDILEAMDQPTIDGINTYFISKYAKKAGLTAVLSGVGADELLGGYPSFTRYNQWTTLRKTPKLIAQLASRKVHSSLGRLAYLHLPAHLSLYLMNRGLFPLSFAAQTAGISLKKLMDACLEIDGVEASREKNINDACWIEQNFFMKNQLLKDNDFMGMWHGIEIRMPFLDKELIEVANKIDPSLKVNNRIAKHLLVKAFATILPSEIWQRSKQGFTFPFAEWMKDTRRINTNNSNKELNTRYQSGRLHWSRYWASSLALEGKFA